MAQNVGTIYYEVDADTSKLVNSVDGADSSLDKMGRQFGKTDKAAAKSEMRLTKTAKAIQGLGKQSNLAAAAFGAFTGALAGLATLRTGQVVLEMAGAWTELQNRLRLVTSSQKELARSTNDVFKVSQTTSQSIDSVAQVYQRFAQNAGSLGINLDQVAGLTETVSKAVAVSGASAQEAQAALTQFGQALASGALRGDELNSVMEQTPALAKAIADGMGITVGQLRAVAAEGKITAKELVRALQNAAESVDAQFNSRIKTVDQSMTELRNSLTRFVGEADSATGITAGLADAISSASQAVDSANFDQLAKDVDTVKVLIGELSSEFAKMSASTQKEFGALARYLPDSFEESVKATAKEIDGLYGVFAGTAGAVEGIWDALATNIPAFFANAWNTVLGGAARFVNNLADMVNVPLQKIGVDAIEHVDWGGEASRAVVSITDAAKAGWDAATKSAGAYEALMNKLADRKISRAISGWESEYAGGSGGGSGKPSGSTPGASGGKGGDSAAKRQAKAVQDLLDTINPASKALREYNSQISLLNQLLESGRVTQEEYAAGLDVLGEKFAKSVFSQEKDPRAAKFGDDPNKYIRGDAKPLSGGEFDEQMARYDAEAKAEEERYAEQLKRLQEYQEYRRQLVAQGLASEDEIKQAHAQATAETEQAAYEAGIEDQEAKYEVKVETEAERNEADLERLAEQKALEQQIKSDAMLTEEQLAQEHAARMQQIEQAKNTLLLRSGEQTFGAMADVIGAFAGKQSALYKTMFAASKAFAIATTLINIKTAIGEAWKLPWPENLAAVATVTANTASLVSDISSVAIGGGKQYGGSVAPNSMYRVNETGQPEILNMANGRQYLLPNQRGEVVSNRDAMTTGRDSSRPLNASPAPTKVMQVNLHGEVFSSKTVRGLIALINEEMADGSRLNIT